MKRFLKYLVLPIAVAVGLGYLVVNHSIADEIQIVCKGSFYSGGEALDDVAECRGLITRKLRP